jgi:Rieske Fe-S protein
LLAAIAALAIAVAIVFARTTPDRPTARPASSNVLPVPGENETVAAFLGDGQPVFVVRHTDGTVSVVDAFSTHGPIYGVSKLVGWCASSRTFDDPFHGSKFNAYGRYLVGPAPSGLARYEIERLSGDRVRVGQLLPPLPRELRPAPGFQGPLCDGETTTLLFHTFEPDAIWRSPATLVQAAPTGWVPIRAVLVVRPGGPALLCARFTEGNCESGAVVRGIDVDGIVDELSRIAQDALWLARVEGAGIADLTRVPLPA